MSFELFIGGRYLRARQKQAFISLITILSVAGVTIGVMALIVVIAVMSGAESDFRSRILKVESHVVLMRHGGAFTNYHRILEDVKSIDGVEKAAPFVYAQIMLRSSSGVSGAVLRGIDPESKDQEITSIEKAALQQKLMRNH
jgi:lipoprotein-releasing system permease protein